MALNPSTPISAIEEVAADVDHVLVMSVNPGFGGRPSSHGSESKIQAIRALLDQAGNRAPIEVDGGGCLQRRSPGISRGLDPGRRQRDLLEPDPAAATRELRAAAAAAIAALTVPSSVTHLRVRYAETDKMGVVYYANYLVWFEVARADLPRSLGYLQGNGSRGNRAAGHRSALRVPAARTV